MDSVQHASLPLRKRMSLDPAVHSPYSPYYAPTYFRPLVPSFPVTYSTRYFEEGVAVFQPMILFSFFLSFWGAAGAFSVQAQAQTDSTSNSAEGYALHRPTNTLFHYRLGRDSTVHIRQGRSPKSDSVVAIPANTFASIYQRVNEEILLSNRAQEHLAIGYEDKYLVLQFAQRFDLYVLGTLIFVLITGGGLLLWLWWRLSKEKRRRAALTRSRRYLAEGREKERKRLAKEIHDGPVQDLHGLHMQLNALPDLPQLDQLQNVGSELMRVTGELRAMSADLHPPALKRFGLPAALRSHADRLRTRHEGLQIELDTNDECNSIPDAFELSLFRIAQEAMNNAVQHGNADQIRVHLHCAKEAVELEVTDDGAGFAPPDDWHSLPDQDHYGLFGMLERAEALGATLDVESSPGHGTRIHLRGSINSSPEHDEPSVMSRPSSA